MLKNNTSRWIDLLNKPILTDKTTRLLEENQYCFTVKKEANKNDIKYAIEQMFNVKVIKINTLRQPIKTRTVGKFTGHKTLYKKAIVKLSSSDKIILFPEN
uniref:Large ribosomal subunit protein uL23c n=1 Tax=Helminthora furcellata TaxID=1884666 RepID=A0A1G4NR93_9FLOR|nr:Ribosomal protein L23 [Helminthora furcellata]SCW21182.1 Ribosomal protein L23 [Helminthora furcellata]SCW24042.1 Ribosomal protein L23 [Helminthora furcellata]